MGWDEIMLQLLADLYIASHTDPSKPRPKPFPLPFATPAQAEEVTPEERADLTERLERYSAFARG